MNSRHRIRLAGPWEAEILDSFSHQEFANTHLKAALGGTDEPGQPFHGNLKLRRKFNLPTGLDEHSVVWLCAEGLPFPTQCQIFLNQRPVAGTDGDLAANRQIEVAVTDTLENFNRIEIGLACSAALTVVQITEKAASVIVQASVWLEIE